MVTMVAELNAGHARLHYATLDLFDVLDVDIAPERCSNQSQGQHADTRDQHESLGIRIRLRNAHSLWRTPFIF